LLIAVVVVVAMQLVPFGRNHENPPVVQEPAWSAPEVRQLAVAACYDCHSNETKWPWYTWVAPMSWLVYHDVEDGRKHMNFSEWDRKQKDAHEAPEMVEEGEMPPWFYLPVHPEAKLTADEKAQLIRGLKATVGED
jgi:Haem-binding domain